LAEKDEFGRPILDAPFVAYSEDQPRDEQGRWTSDGGGVDPWFDKTIYEAEKTEIDERITALEKDRVASQDEWDKIHEELKNTPFELRDKREKLIVKEGQLEAHLETILEEQEKLPVEKVALEWKYRQSGAKIPLGEDVGLEDRDIYRKYTKDRYADSVRRWIEKSPDNRAAVLDVEDYVDNGYVRVNRHLTGYDPDPSVEPKIANISKYIDENRIRDNITLFRGTSVHQEIANEQFKEGAIFNAKSFQSMTTSPQIAGEFMKGGQERVNLRFRVEAAPGDPIAPAVSTYYPESKSLVFNVQEQEFIAKPGTKFRIVEVEKGKIGRASCRERV
jgi:hypothetical protein